MRSSRFFPVAVLRSSCRRWPAASSAAACSRRQDEVPQQYRIFTAALDAIETRVRRRRSSPIGSSTARSTACCRRSIRIRASSIRAATRRCASGRRAATTASASPSRSIDGDITVMSMFEGSPAYRKGIRRGDVIARIEGEDAKGWTSDQAVAKLQRPEGHDRQHLAQAPRLRRPDRSRDRARRGQHHRPCAARS